MDFHYRVGPTLFLDSYFVVNGVLLATGWGWWEEGGQGGTFRQEGYDISPLPPGCATLLPPCIQAGPAGSPESPLLICSHEGPSFQPSKSADQSFIQAQLSRASKGGAY